MTEAQQRLASGNYALVVLILGLLAAPAPVHADDFPNDVKRTFTTDIPHFFQDDVPCAFGGQPTSGTKTSCDAPPDNAPGNAPTEPPPAKPEPATPPANNGH